jgi:hypothetical protein
MWMSVISALVLVTADTLPISITQSGKVTAQSVGEATVAVTHDDVTATRLISVSAPLTAPVATTVDVVIHKTDAGTGTVLVSSGMPLPKGLVTSATLQKFRLIVDQKEVPLFVEPLFGKHADGSYKSVLIQFPMELTHGQNITGQLQFGPQGIRTGTKTPVDWALLEPAIILPTSPVYILSTGVMLKTMAVNDLPTTALYTAYESRYAQWSAFHFSYTDLNCTNYCAHQWGRNYYDAALAGYAQWARTGNIEYWKRATIFARLHTRGEPLSQPHNYQPDGLYYNYVFTGDERNRQYLIIWSQNRTGWWTVPRVYEWSFGNYREGRQQQRVMLAALYAGLLEDTSRDWLGMVDGYVKGWVETQEPKWAMEYDSLSVDGAWHYPLDGANGQSNFMEGLRVSAMITYLELRQPPEHVRLATELSIQKQVDYLWNTQWNPAARAFNYWSSDYRGVPWPDPPTDSQIYMHELNNLMVLGFAYTYHVTGDVTYKDRALEIFSVAFLPPPGWGPWWAGLGGKIFNENYYSSWRVFYYLNSVR